MPPPVLALIFGFPAAVYFAAVGIPVAAAFFYRRRARTLEVPAVALWETIGRPVELRSFSSLLRRLLSLLAQLLLVALLIVALADPWPRAAAARRVVLVLDVSATMQTREGGADRMEAARRRAIRALDALPDGAEVAVILAARSPVLAQPPTKDLAVARRVVAGQRALDVEGDLAAAVRTASAFADPAVPVDVLVVSDFAALAPRVLREQWNTLKSPGRLRLAAVGRDHPDVAVTDFWSEPQSSRDGAAGDGAGRGGATPRAARDARRVVATLTQRGMEGGRVAVRLLVDGRPVAAQQVQLGPGASAVEFSADASPGAVLKVEVDSRDDLAVDDAAFLVVPATERTSVCLVTRGNPALERALRADPSVRLRVTTAADFRGGQGASVVVDDDPDLPAEDAAGAAASGYLFVGTADPFGWGKATGWVDVPPVTHWAGEHPTLQDVDPSLMRIPRALRMAWAVPGPVTAAVSADTTPLVVSLSIRGTEPGGAGTGASPGAAERGRRCVYWLFDLNSTDLPRRVSFPLMLWNTIEYLAGHSGEATLTATLTGRPFQLTGGSAGPVVGPDGRPVAVRSSGASGLRAVYDTDRQGVYTSRGPAGPEAHAVSLLSARGTVPLPADRPDDEAGPAADAPAPSGLAAWKRHYGRLAWDSVLLAAVALGLCEWFLFHRRILQVG